MLVGRVESGGYGWIRWVGLEPAGRVGAGGLGWSRLVGLDLTGDWSRRVGLGPVGIYMQTFRLM